MQDADGGWFFLSYECSLEEVNFTEGCEISHVSFHAFGFCLLVVN